MMSLQVKINNNTLCGRTAERSTGGKRASRSAYLVSFYVMSMTQ